jgi:hypothetical protein
MDACDVKLNHAVVISMARTTFNLEAPSPSPYIRICTLSSASSQSPVCCLIGIHLLHGSYTFQQRMHLQAFLPVPTTAYWYPFGLCSRQIWSSPLDAAQHAKKHRLWNSMQQKLQALCSSTTMTMRIHSMLPLEVLLSWRLAHWCARTNMWTPRTLTMTVASALDSN